MPDQTPNQTGRPSTYTRETADAVIALMVADEPQSMREACKALGVAPGTFAGWVVEDHDGLAERYARAMQVRATVLADEIVEIADDSRQDTDEEGRPNHEHIQRSRLRVDTRKFVLAKVLPRIWGDKVQLTGDGGGPVTVKQEVDLTKLTDEQLAALAQLSGALAHPAGQRDRD